MDSHGMGWRTINNIPSNLTMAHIPHCWLYLIPSKIPSVWTKHRIFVMSLAAEKNAHYATAVARYLGRKREARLGRGLLVEFIRLCGGFLIAHLWNL